MSWLQDTVISLSEGLSRRLSADDDHYAAVQGDLLAETTTLNFVIATIMIMTFGSLAAGAGVGGGGLFVPIYAFVLGVGPRAAVPLSKSTILGAAIGNFVSIGFQRHPRANRPMIDYETSSFMQAGELLGVIFGVLLNLLLPEILIIVSLATLLTFTAVKTIRKGLSWYRKEGEEIKRIADREAKKEQQISQCIEMVPPEEGQTDSEKKEDVNLDDGESDRLSETGSEMLADGMDAADFPHHHKGVVDKGDDDRSPALQQLYDDAAKQFPTWPYTIILLMTGFTIVYAYVKHDFISPCQPAVYWSFYFSPVLVLGGAMLLIAYLLNQTHMKREALGYHYLDTDVQFTREQLNKFPVVALLAGVFAGMLGIGGGMVIGPLFIEIGMEPQVGTSSCAFMILWTATSGCIQYYYAGKLGWRFLCYFVFFGFLSGQLGQRLVNKVLRMTGRPSYVVLLLGGIISLACLAMTGTGILKVVTSVLDGESLFSFTTQDFECQDDD